MILAQDANYEKFERKREIPTCDVKLLFWMQTCRGDSEDRGKKDPYQELYQLKYWTSSTSTASVLLSYCFMCFFDQYAKVRRDQVSCWES